MAVDNNNEVKMPKELLPEDVELQAQDMNPSEDVDIQMMEDGGAIVDFDPQAGAMEGAEIHTANLAEFMDDGDLVEISSEVLEAYEECASSRDEWEQTYKKGLDKYYGLIGLAEEAGIFKKVSTRYEMPDGSKVFGKNINDDPEKYFTKEVLDKIDEYAKRKFSYGSDEE